MGSELSVILAGLLPMIEGEEDDDVPPLMRRANVINPSWKPDFRNSGDVKEQCQSTYQIHNSNLTDHVEDVWSCESAILHYPMNAGQHTEGTPRHKKDQSDLAVLVVQILRCGLDNQRHNKHGRTNADVNGPSHVMTPEGVINSRSVDGQKAERNAAQVVRQPAMVRIFRVTAESMISS